MVVDLFTREILWTKEQDDEKTGPIEKLPPADDSKMSEWDKQLRELLKKAQGL